MAVPKLSPRMIEYLRKIAEGEIDQVSQLPKATFLSLYTRELIKRGGGITSNWVWITDTGKAALGIHYNHSSDEPYIVTHRPTYDDLRAELHIVECVLAQLETLTDGYVRRTVKDELARVDALLAHCQ